MPNRGEENTPLSIEQPAAKLIDKQKIVDEMQGLITTSHVLVRDAKKAKAESKRLMSELRARRATLRPPEESAAGANPDGVTSPGGDQP